MSHHKNDYGEVFRLDAATSTSSRDPARDAPPYNDTSRAGGRGSGRAAWAITTEAKAMGVPHSPLGFPYIAASGGRSTRPAAGAAEHTAADELNLEPRRHPEHRPHRRRSADRTGATVGLSRPPNPPRFRTGIGTSSASAGAGVRPEPRRLTIRRYNGPAPFVSVPPGRPSERHHERARTGICAKASSRETRHALSDSRVEA
jgi:hypothetical protein